MIYDKLDNLETYAPISERLAKGLQLLRTTDFPPWKTENTK